LALVSSFAARQSVARDEACLWTKRDASYYDVNYSPGRDAAETLKVPEAPYALHIFDQAHFPFGSTIWARESRELMGNITMKTIQEKSDRVRAAMAAGAIALGIFFVTLIAKGFG
jgi:hypothetical protein